MEPPRSVVFTNRELVVFLNHSSSPFFSKLNERRVTVVMMMMDGDKRGRDENERRLTSDGTSTRKEDEEGDRESG